MTARRWTFSIAGARPTTLNDWGRLANWRARHAHDKEVRKQWGWMALSVRPRVPRLAHVRLEITPLHATFASPQDVVACAAYAKAAIDGLITDGGICPDDGPAYVGPVTFHPPRVCGVDGLELVVIDASEET